jgi:ParB family chromosome partitioning protein
LSIDNFSASCSLYDDFRHTWHLWERSKLMAGNRGFGDALADGYDSSRTPPARPALPTDSVLASRSTTLAELATGKIVNDRTLWVSAARCRPWQYHNRDQALLNEVSCADLIDSLKAEGRQRLPAIVRRLKDEPDYDYEIIAGVRRHWSIAWLNSHNYPNFEFLVTVQTLTDEEAFRLADVENRARQDLTDLERARDYLKAIDLFYGGKQNEMAERLNVQASWLSRLLDLARLPDVVLAAEAIAGRAVPVRAADVVRQLQRAAVATPPKARAGGNTVTLSAARKPMLKVGKRRGGGVLLEFLGSSGATRAELQAAFEAVLAQYAGDKPFG